jgi:hypothetical protein
VRTFTEKLGDGNTINRTTQTTLYRDSQGRTRTETTVTPPASSGKQPYTRIEINDPIAGQRHELDSSTMTSRTTRIPKFDPSAAATRTGRGPNAARATAPAAAAGRGRANVTKADLGSQLKNGVLAAGSQETEVIAAGKIGNAQPITVVRETWYSAELKMPVEVKVVDPQRGNSTTEMTNLVPGEPSASLFAIPSGYTDKTVGGRGGRGGNFARGVRPPAGS